MINKNMRGITLVALIITIIILLILAGVAISSLTENGLFEKAKLAKEKQNESKVKEKVQLLLSEYEIESASNKELKLIDYFYEKEDSKEIDSVEDKKDGTIGIIIEGYSFIIDMENRTIIDIKINNDINIKYELVSYSNNKFKILIKIAAPINGLEKIEFLDKNIECSGEKDYLINYELEEGIDYTIKVTNTKKGEKIEVINLVKPSEPTLEVLNSGYTILTDEKMKMPELKIKYDERENFRNYYSLDDGKTWNLYTAPINASEKTIKVKSEHEKCEGLYTEKTITLNLPSDMLFGNAYDGNMETYADYRVWPHSCKFYIDDTCWDKYISLHFRLYDFTTGYYRRQQIVFKDENNQIIDTYTSPDVQTGIVNNIMAKIPKNTKSVSISSDLYLSIYEVSLKLMTPEITYSGYPKLTDTGFINEKNVAIKYDDSDSIENYYSEDDGNTWKKYSKDFFTTANKIMAKSIIKEYNIESYISTKELKDPADTIGKEAYDGNMETYADYRVWPYSCKFYIDDTCWDKYISLHFRLYDFTTGYYRRQQIVFKDENNQIIDTYTSPDVQTGIVNNIMAKIPKNTKSVSISSDLYLSIYEVSLKLMTPEITYSGYPKLTDTGFINEKNVAIKYDDSDSIENYYSEDDGNTWKKYSKDFFTTANKIMAKSIIKEYNIESYISTKELKDPADTIGKEAYDGNLDSYCLSFPTIRFDIDESVWNKNINMKLSVNYWSSFKREIYITFMNENNEEISKTQLGELNSWSTNLGIYTVEVPNNSKYATINMDDTPLQLKVYEIYK